MISVAFEEIKTLLREATLKRVVTFMVIVLAGVAIFLLFDRTTGYFYLSGIERRVVILGELHELSEQGIDNDSMLSPIYHDLARELARYDERGMFGRAPNLRDFGDIGSRFARLVVGGSIWWMLATYGLWERRQGSPRWGSTVGGGVALAILFGLPAAFLPTFPVVAYIVYAVIQFGFVLALAKLFPTKRNRAAKAGEKG